MRVQCWVWGYASHTLLSMWLGVVSNAVVLGVAMVIGTSRSDAIHCVPPQDETNEPFEVGIKAIGLLRELDQDLVDCHGNMEAVSGCTAAERCCGGGGCEWMYAAAVLEAVKMRCCCELL